MNYRLAFTDWANIRSAMGIADNPVSSIGITAKIINTSTEVWEIDLGTMTSTQDLSSVRTNIALTEKTPYSTILYTDFAGQGKTIPCR